MLAQPFNGPPMHGAANTFIAAMVRHAVGLYFSRPTGSQDRLASLAIVEVELFDARVSNDMLVLFNELGRSCSPAVAADREALGPERVEPSCTTSSKHST